MSSSKCCALRETGDAITPYSNAAYLVPGAVIEEASRRTRSERIIAETVLVPLERASSAESRSRMANPSSHVAAGATPPVTTTVDLNRAFGARQVRHRADGACPG